jgi:hypothetical protein
MLVGGAGKKCLHSETILCWSAAPPEKNFALDYVGRRRRKKIAFGNNFMAASPPEICWSAESQRSEVIEKFLLVGRKLEVGGHRKIFVGRPKAGSRRRRKKNFAVNFRLVGVAGIKNIAVENNFMLACVARKKLHSETIVCRRPRRSAESQRLADVEKCLLVS